MKIKQQVPIERIIGKIDNDFNISESDWIPRVAAWTIDCLAQLRCLPMERKRRQLKVIERIATFPCELNAKEIRVFDINGCEIAELNEAKGSCCNSGSSVTVDAGPEIAVFDSSNKSGVDFMKVNHVVDRDKTRNFVVDGNSIELNFNTDYIFVESYEVATYHDDYYDCDVPYIYDNGILIEAICWYILFKYLSRGSHHPVYSLTATNEVINPFAQWSAIKDKARIAVKNDLAREDGGWRNFFFNSTFDPRR